MNVAQILNSKILIQKDFEQIKQLSQKKIDINEKDNKGCCALFNALNHENLECLKLLFEYPEYREQFTSATSCDGHHDMPYFFILKRYETTQYLIEKFNLDLNWQDDFGCTIVHMLASEIEKIGFYSKNSFNSLDIKEKLYNLTLSLLNKGANFNIRNKAGYTFIELIDDPVCIKAISKAQEMFDIINEHQKLNKTLPQAKFKNKAKL